MKVGVLTSLYPTPSRPREGIFAERRWVRMAARGHEVRVVQPLPRTPGPLARGRWDELRRAPREEHRDGVPVKRPRYLHVPRLARANARHFARTGVRTLLGAEIPDVVVLDYAWPAAEAAPLLHDAGVPVVLHGRGSDVLEVAGEAGLGAELARCLRSVDAWCAVSRDLVRALDRLAGREAGRLTPNGVDLERFAPGDRFAARAHLGLPGEGTLVLVVGHLIPRKDPLLALEAFRRGAPSSARLAFVGRGPLRAELEAAARRAGLSARVMLCGEADPEELLAWYRAADCLLLTSRREGRPNVVLEALACGLPVVATAAGGTAELFESLGGRGLVEAREPERVAAELLACLADPPRAEELRAAVAPLSWNAALDALESVLEDACRARRGAS